MYRDMEESWSSMGKNIQKSHDPKVAPALEQTAVALKCGVSNKQGLSYFSFGFQLISIQTCYKYLKRCPHILVSTYFYPNLL